MNNVIEKVKEKFAEKLELEVKSARRAFANVAPQDAKEIVVYLFKVQGARLSTITSIDTRTGIELLYHMAVDGGSMILTVRTMVRKPELKIASITTEIDGAEWIEREIHEMMGVDFIGHPKMERLLLPDDWGSLPADRQGEQPYRKQTFESESEGIER